MGASSPNSCRRGTCRGGAPVRRADRRRRDSARGRRGRPARGLARHPAAARYRGRVDRRRPWRSVEPARKWLRAPAPAPGTHQRRRGVCTSIRRVQRAGRCPARARCGRRSRAPELPALLGSPDFFRLGRLRPLHATGARHGRAVRRGGPRDFTRQKAARPRATRRDADGESASRISWTPARSSTCPRMR